jgi:hypothetical protein
MLRSLTLGLALTLAPLALNAQATTKCTDGTTSTASGRGACSGHGGVAKQTAAKTAKSTAKAETKAATKSDVKAATKSDQKASKAAAAETKVAAKTAKAESKTASATDANGATAKCKDGTYSHAASRRGACSKHGGVAEWLKS